MNPDMDPDVALWCHGASPARSGSDSTAARRSLACAFAAAFVDAIAGPRDGAPGPGLRQSGRAYVRELRAGGLPPEQVVVAVKGVIAGAGLPPGAPSRDVALLSEQVISWCIADYFRSD